MINSGAELSWRGLDSADVDLLRALALACQAHDGGSPFATDPDYLADRFLNGVSTGALVDDRLVSAGAVRDFEPTGPHRQTAIVGLVDPAWRGRGIGGRVVDWALHAATAPPRVETEMLTPEHDALLRSRGLRQTLAEDVMRVELPTSAPCTPLPMGLRLREWTGQLTKQFFEVYTAAFADRPGFPGWSCERWVEWISDDPDFNAQWTLLADIHGHDVGFVAGAPDPQRPAGWIVQVGVVPAARRRGLGSSLVAEAMRRMRATGLQAVFLNVNINNPGAARAYRRLGFKTIGQRARYEP